jgi:ATP-dependent Clp protease ATP-binding subunit ClpB
MSSYDPATFTQKTAEAVNKSLELAQSSKHIELAPAHMAMVLFNEPNGLAQRICTKAKVEAKSVLTEVKSLLGKMSVQDPPPNDISPNAAFLKMLRTANARMKAQGDEFMTIDHLLGALTENDDVSKALAKAGLPAKKIEALIKEVRGTSKVTSKQAETTYEALNKYGHDLVKDAEDGKLDPVIGRDEEMCVHSTRTAHACAHALFM